MAPPIGAPFSSCTTPPMEPEAMLAMRETCVAWGGRCWAAAGRMVQRSPDAPTAAAITFRTLLMSSTPAPQGPVPSLRRRDGEGDFPRDDLVRVLVGDLD